MCKQDIQIGRRSVATPFSVTADGGSRKILGPANPQRISITVCVTSWGGIVRSTAVTGTIDPVTGVTVLAEDQILGGTGYLSIGYMNGMTFVALLSLTPESPSGVLRVDDLGPAVMAEVVTNLSAGGSIGVSGVDVHLPVDLGEL